MSGKLSCACRFLFGFVEFFRLSFSYICKFAMNVISGNGATDIWLRILFAFLCIEKWSLLSQFPLWFYGLSSLLFNNFSFLFALVWTAVRKSNGHGSCKNNIHSHKNVLLKLKMKYGPKYGQRIVQKTLPWILIQSLIKWSPGLEIFAWSPVMEVSLDRVPRLL